MGYVLSLHLVETTCLPLGVSYLTKDFNTPELQFFDRQLPMQPKFLCSVVKGFRGIATMLQKQLQKYLERHHPPTQLCIINTTLISSFKHQFAHPTSLSGLVPTNTLYRHQREEREGTRAVTCSAHKYQVLAWYHKTTLVSSATNLDGVQVRLLGRRRNPTAISEDGHSDLSFVPAE